MKYIIGTIVIAYIFYAIWKIAKDVCKQIEYQHQNEKEV